MRDFALRVSWKRELLEDLDTLFSGKTDAPIRRRWPTSRCCARRVFVAPAYVRWRRQCTPQYPVN